MFRSTLTAVLLLAALTASQTHAATVAYWDFNAGTLEPTLGAGSIDTSAFGAAASLSNPGSNINAQPPTAVPGDSLFLDRGSQAGNNGKSITVTIDTTSLALDLLSLAAGRSGGQGFNLVNIHASTDGQTFSPVGSIVAANSAFGLQSFSLANMGLDNLPSVVIRFTFANASSTGGGSHGYRIDNLLITSSVNTSQDTGSAAVPEPASMATCSLMLLALGATRRRAAQQR